MLVQVHQLHNKERIGKPHWPAAEKLFKTFPINFIRNEIKHPSICKAMSCFLGRLVPRWSPLVRGVQQNRALSSQEVFDRSGQNNVCWRGENVFIFTGRQSMAPRTMHPWKWLCQGAGVFTSGMLRVTGADDLSKVFGYKGLRSPLGCWTPVHIARIRFKSKQFGPKLLQKILLRTLWTFNLHRVSSSCLVVLIWWCWSSRLSWSGQWR